MDGEHIYVSGESVNSPLYYRCRHGRVEFWDGERWLRSLLASRLSLLDDLLGGGGPIREILDPAELPDA